MNEIFIRMAAFPKTIKGVTVTDGNGDYNIYINSSLSDSEQKRTLKHELTHIRRHDFNDISDIDDIERNMP